MFLLVSTAKSFGVNEDHNKNVKFPLVLDMVHNNPGEAPYKSKFNDPKVLRNMGYNGKVYSLFESPTLAIDWRDLDKNIFPADCPDKKWIENKANEITVKYRDCHNDKMSTWAMSDLILFPKKLIEKYGIQDIFGNPQNDTIRKLLHTQIDEIFTQFPDLDGLVVRIGETYLHDAPYHLGRIDDKRNVEKTIIPLINLLRDEICVKRNKMLIFRTWVTFDTNIDSYMKVSNAIEPHKNLIIGVKHCEGDFHRSNNFSKVIGLGRHKQIIEVQCAREYEGKGAYPNYIANGVINGFEEHKNLPYDIKSLKDFYQKKPELYAGVWTWSRGGGWNGPYITNEMWCDLNAWVVANWAKNPKMEEEIIFNQYAKEKLKLNPSDVKKFRELCLLSAQAVIRGKTTVEGDVSPWWSRDEGIGLPIINKDKTNIARFLSQKDESIEKWNKIVSLAESIKWSDSKTKSFAVSSCYYGLYLYKIYRAVCNITIAQKQNDTAALRKWIKEYDNAWALYSNLPNKFDNVSTLYDKNFDRHMNSNAEREINKIKKELGII